jgi:hypothetical protein
MDWDAFFRGLNFVGTLVLGIWTFVLNRRKANQMEAEATRLLMSQLQERILTLELQMRHMPDDEQLNKLAEQIGALAGDVKGLKSEMTGFAKELAPLSRSVEMINHYLLTSRQP